MNLQSVSRRELICLIEALRQRDAKQLEVIASLEKRIEELEKKLREPPPEPVLPPKAPVRVKASRPPGEKKPRKKRAKGYGRKKSKPTRYVEHALEKCGACGHALRGGSVKRTREVLHIPLAPMEVIGHQFIERQCLACGKRQTPSADVLQGEVLGQHRISLETMAMIAALHEEGRLPINLIAWFLQAFWGLELSQGGIVEILHVVAEHGQKQVEEIHQEICSSPVVHADETTWRESGQNGYFWSFSTTKASYFEYRQSRAGQVVEDILGKIPDTLVVCDFYAAYNRHQGPIQRCWAHLLRAIHDLKQDYPDDEAVQVWGKAVHALYLEACAFRDRHRDDAWTVRYDGAARFEKELLILCEPFLDRDVPQRVLSQRCQRFIKQLFHFVVNLDVPPDNNAAERAVRPLAVCRKISGGTRSPRGSVTKGILASLFGTWRLQGLDPLVACTKLLSSPQI
jgi:transposase